MKNDILTALYREIVCELTFTNRNYSVGHGEFMLQ